MTYFITKIMIYYKNMEKIVRKLNFDENFIH
jgi:hypothetical protein